MSSSKVNDGHGGHHFSGTHYVVSEDVDVLVARWCKSKGWQPPARSFYRELRLRMQDFLRGIFAHVTMINSAEIRSGLLKSVARHKKDGLFVVSLERAYLEDSEVDGRIELTRTVDGQLEDIVIPSVRNGTAEKSIQFRNLREKKIALVDDVVFTGGTLINTVTELHLCHANVHTITSAVGVKDGINNIKRTHFGVIGMPESIAVTCLEEFDDVSDQVCERDFYPGVPYSGRQHFTNGSSFPYILPFGRPDKWASIPEKELRRFSALCLDNTIELFKKIEQVNGIKITCDMVPRPVFGLPKDKTNFAATLLNKAREGGLL